jgi:hypothetical protein
MRAASLTVLDKALRDITAEREYILESSRMAQEHIQQLTSMCQNQHRARVQQQVRLLPPFGPHRSPAPAL